MSFEQWKNEVNKLLIAELGVDSDMLEDWRWYESYEDKDTPEEAVNQFRDDLIDINW